jgi:hypothetical protein
MIELSASIQDRAPERVVGSDAELEATLEEATLLAKAAGKLNIIFLYAPNRDHLTLVVGGEETVLGFNYGHGDPPYFASRGPAQTDSPMLTAYVGLEHHTEFPRLWVVPARLGTEAAKEFRATGRRPSAVEWVEA